MIIPASRRSYNLLPAFLLLGTKIIDALLIHFRVRPNPYLKDVFMGRNTALVPDENGAFDEQNPASQKVAVLLFGTKSNHPFGFLAPAFIEMGGWMQKMNHESDSTDVP